MNHNITVSWPNMASKHWSAHNKMFGKVRSPDRRTPQTVGRRPLESNANTKKSPGRSDDISGGELKNGRLEWKEEISAENIRTEKEDREYPESNIGEAWESTSRRSHA